MDIIQGLIETGNAGKSGWRIVNNGGAIGVLNNRTSNVYFSILNDGGIGTSSNVPVSLINSYSGINVSNYSGSGNVVSTGGTGGTGGSSQWTTVGTKIYYNLGNIGIGTLDPIAPLHIYNNAITAVLPTEIVVAGATSATISGTTDRVISFPYSGTGTTKDYTFTTTEALICDILIVGGGGAGGTYIGGGGGAGGVLYIQNVNIGVGTYNISVGRGGVGFTGAGASTILQNGSSSKAFGIEVFGGGYGGSGGWGTGASGQNGASGGSGGAGGSTESGNAGVGGSITQPSFTNSLITVNTYNYYGGNGATSMIYNGIAGIGIGANGGGGAGGNAPANTDQANAGAGADGIAINITGTSYFWGGGGGGGQYNGVKAGNGGKGGGGGGNGSQVTEAVGIGGTGGITLGQDGDLEGDGTPTAGNGGDGTGGGGGGTGRTIGSPNAVSGAGGSGIVIIRYRRQTQSSVSNARLLLDATTTGTATVEFRRGTGADSQNDYRFINDSNGSLKLQCENTAQVFGNTVADLAWFSSNETIIHKNTTMNGRVGIGTVYHASRSLDVVGDANVSGVLSVAGSLSVTSNAIITNSITSNTSFTIHNGLLPPLPNEITVVPLASEIVVAGTTSGIIGADRYISFPYSGSASTKDYTFTTTENLICDILMIGGGGAGGFDRAGGGGAGSCIIALSQTLGVGTYNIKVGSGQPVISNNTTSGTGGDSEIFLSNSILYRAKGGGNGGAAAVNNATAGGCGGGAGSQGPLNGGSATNLNYIAGNLVNANTTTTTYANLGFKGGDQLVGWNGSNGDQLDGAGGGGIGGAGVNHNVGEINGTAGGASLDRVVINTSTYIFKDYFAGGGTLGVNGFIGGGGGGGNYGGGGVGNGGGGGAGNGGGSSAIANTGSGGGGGASGSGSGGAGGSGIVIIRYRKVPADIINETISGIVGTTDRYTIFPYSGTGATKDYSITTTENLGCDILMIGGGGGGGIADAGGGGAGACIVAVNQSLNAGNYTIRVGNGGLGGAWNNSQVITQQSTNGTNSSIFNSSGIEIYRAVGGGRAGAFETSGVNSEYIGKTGGCGGGAGFWQGNSGVSGGAVSTLNIVNSTPNISPSVSTTYGVYGNIGGNMQQWTNGNYSTANAGGGGGIGAAGASGVASTNRSGVGGNGLALVTINSIQYNFKTYFAPDWSTFGVLSGGLLYIGGGGGGGGFSNSSAKVSGGLGGGGIGDNANVNSTFLDAPTNGMANTGSGGGGASGNAGASGGAGGSGLIIVRYRKLPNEIVVTGTTSTVIGSTDRCIVFPYSGSASTKDYTFTTTEALSCDVLIVGGGGQGGCTDAGAGGAGGLVFILNKSFTSGTYTINVGSGGIDVGSYGVSRAGTNGSDTIINFGGNTFLVAKGGGGGGTGFPPEYSGVSGGSGGGAGSTVDDVNKKIGASSIQSQQAGDSSTYGYGNKGGDNNTEGTYYGGGGGGGASEAGKNGGLNSNQGIGGNGLAQLTLSGTIYNFKTFFGLPTSGVGEYISGEDNIYFAGGGGGGHTYNSANATSQDKNGGKGGGGQGRGVGNGVAGLATTGGGGGGGGGGHGRGGNGGSGIVIIRYRLPSAISSSSINFIRGTTADTNHDYKVGNFNGEFKVISSVFSASNIDTDYIRITTAGAITNPSGTANWNIGSDRRIKENIERASYDKCFENINRLELNRFNYVSGFNTVNRDRTQLGFIAQEVYDIFPKSISTHGYYSDTLNIPDLLSIDVSQINYSLYGAVKKLIEINNDKDNRLKALDDELKTIETILNITPEAVASNVVLEPVIISMTSNVVLEEITSNVSNVSNVVLEEITSNVSNVVLEEITSNVSNVVLEEMTSNITVDS